MSGIISRFRHWLDAFGARAASSSTPAATRMGAMKMRARAVRRHRMITGAVATATAARVSATTAGAIHWIDGPSVDGDLEMI